ncbi:DUF554 domain-containing protein [Clostridium sp. 'White wine YQ']|uniref:DUF554 domain-containing protein n=1 Tax=Clostridium sp. 'White wine YQ' TaxID=3027474 RepID=UPI00236620B1|nr:DUF554 domain-containing protein [Clostridium sp. 'White wine YQ']MDD7795796.1 DUF554 domain-containing protein [Clostridium sp. 'White wine YQ']
MLGTIINFIAILIGGSLGLFIKGGLPKRFMDTIMNGIALCIIYIGFSGAIKSEQMLLIVVSIVIGSLIGELIDIDGKLVALGNFIESKSKKSSEGVSISQGFVTASLLFCVGAMAIVGALEGGLSHKHDILFTKSILDGITSIILSSTLGIGVLLSAFCVLIYQGIIVLGSSLLQGILTTSIITEMSAVGSLLILGLGLNMLGITKIKVANMLPGIIVPIIYGIVISHI